ncbi:MAG: hypothetical protein FJ096_08850 [Deltaproteobacteria bacterium]|nr:hypothetical protein [Deltaproteobacteria bacterium]
MQTHWRGALVVGATLAGAGCPLEPLDAPPACSLAGCDDANDCTVDTCDAAAGRCVFTPVPTGTQCDTDGDVCNGIDRCDAAGKCVTGAALDPDDGLVCTLDSCDPKTGELRHEAIAGCSEGQGGANGSGVSGAVGAGGAGGSGAGGSEPEPTPLWKPLSTIGALTARRFHAAVWTGSKMLVWGGLTSTGVTSTGAVYDPATDSWSPMSMANVPVARHSHSAVWTGSEMIIWGGFSNTYESTGGRYDPARDEWTALPFSTIKGRARHGAVWTGSDMIVWGGSNGIGPLGDGSRYSLGANAWTNLPGGGPSSRFNAVAGWTGSALAVWGGTDTFDWFSDGRYFNPSLNTWSPISTVNRPSLRESSSSAWTGAGLLVWSGWNGGDYLADGFLLKPAVGTGGTWSKMTEINEPQPRAESATVWTGSELCVWGGCGGDSCLDVREDGGCYSPAKDTWRPIPADPSFEGRKRPATVWTGKEILLFGGERNFKSLGGGARLDLDALPK